MDQDEQIISLLEEILLWTKFSFEEIKLKMTKELDSDDKKIAYQLSDGEHSTAQIASVISVSAQTVSNWWRSWLNMGIVKQTDKYGGRRIKRLISLAEMSIPYSELPEIATDE